MSIRRLQYQIEYVHILTFSQEYREMIVPFFVFDGVEYSIENENTIHETIRLIFKKERFFMILNQEAMVLVYEGETSEIKDPAGPLRIFFDIFDKVKTLKGFQRVSRQVMIGNDVTLKTQDEVDDIMANNPYFKKNPFGKIEEFACVYEFADNENHYNISFGNYTNRDIKKHDLMPLRTEFNQDLKKGVGMMARIEIQDKEKNASFSRFKSLLVKIENKLSLINY